MRSTALSSLFFASFSLFSTVAYAAPAAPQGAISKRQCEMSGCRFETPTTSSSGSTNDTAPVVYDVIINLLGLLSNTPDDPQLVTVTASESSSAVTTQPAGGHIWDFLRYCILSLFVWVLLGHFENTDIISWTKLYLLRISTALHGPSSKVGIENQRLNSSLFLVRSKGATIFAVQAAGTGLFTFRKFLLELYQDENPLAAVLAALAAGLEHHESKAQSTVLTYLSMIRVGSFLVTYSVMGKPGPGDLKQEDSEITSLETAARFCVMP
ncbi:hypothetical protein BJV77DRAFT_958631 [Russula vinacea]|nr:hypothetical protein BJV77DRAFT_958631 [Russula vinacea]